MCSFYFVLEETGMSMTGLELWFVHQIIHWLLRIKRLICLSIEVRIIICGLIELRALTSSKCIFLCGKFMPSLNVSSVLQVTVVTPATIIARWRTGLCPTLYFPVTFSFPTVDTWQFSPAKVFSPEDRQTDRQRESKDQREKKKKKNEEKEALGLVLLDRVRI